jgi:hypothetical protein
MTNAVLIQGYGEEYIFKQIKTGICNENYKKTFCWRRTFDFAFVRYGFACRRSGRWKTIT